MAFLLLNARRMGIWDRETHTRLSEKGKKIMKYNTRRLKVQEMVKRCV